MGSPRRQHGEARRHEARCLQGLLLWLLHLHSRFLVWLRHWHRWYVKETQLTQAQTLTLEAYSNISCRAGGVLTLKSYKRDFGYTDSTTVSAVMVSLQNAGAFIAAVCISFISERFGRKRTIMAACAVFCLGVILQVIPSHSLPCFYVGRVISGLGLGSATAVVPSYSAEMAPKEIRGKVGSGVQWLFAAGVMVSYWIDYGVSIGLPESSKQWQIPVGLQLVPASALGLGLLALPESARWLAKKERYEEAWKSLTWIRADDGERTRTAMIRTHTLTLTVSVRRRGQSRVQRNQSRSRRGITSDGRLQEARAP